MTTTNTPTPIAAQAGSRRERPILFSGPMVQAILAGRKTQTRRIIKPQPTAQEEAEGVRLRDGWLIYGREFRGHCIRCPYGARGDRLWVRETWTPYDASPTRAIYRADEPAGHIDRGWHPSIHMPRWASRITLEIVTVRVERLNDIDESDARSEGVTLADRAVSPSQAVPAWWDYLRNEPGYRTAASSFSSLWESINGPGSWDLNPWVWVVEFKTSNTHPSGGRTER